MHILMISRCPPFPIHLGDRLIIYHLARELAQRGHAIDLLAFANRPDDWTLDWAQVCPWFRQVTLLPEPRRRPLDYLRRALMPGARFPRRAQESWSPEMWRAVESRLARNRYDVAHLFGGIQVYEFCRALSGLPAIIAPYESYSLYLRREVELASPSPLPIAIGRGQGWGYMRTRLQLDMARRYESWMFAPYRRVVVVSERDRDELLGLNPRLDIAVIPNGIDLDYFQLQAAEREPATLLFTGNFEYPPNVDAARRLAFHVLPEVRKRVPDARLWLVGHAPPPELLALQSSEQEDSRLMLFKKLARTSVGARHASPLQNGFPSAVRVTGRVPDVRPYLAQATVFACPLRLGAGIKNKVLEALAMGLPVVATRLSVDGIAVRDGHDALIRDEQHLAEGVIRLLRDADLRRKLSTNGRALIERQYSWAQAAAQYEALYRSVIP